MKRRVRAAMMCDPGENLHHAQWVRRARHLECPRRRADVAMRHAPEIRKHRADGGGRGFEIATGEAEVEREVDGERPPAS
jgi:hypothetical protein